MQQRYVGTSGLRVSAVALGTMSWGTDTDEETARDQLRAYTAAGGTTIDTSVTYGEGRSEAILGAMVGDVVARSEVVLVSKAGITRRNGKRMVDTSRRAMLTALDSSLARLSIDHLDLWLAHAWDDNVPLEETLSALDYAVTSGRVRYAGVSNYSGWQLARAATLSRTPLVANQVEYSLLQRGAEAEVTPAAEHLGIGLLCWAPLGRGALTGKYRGQIPADSRGANDALAGYVQPYLSGLPARVTEAVVTAAKGLDRQPLDVALSWLLSRPAVSGTVVGARTAGQLKQILDATLEPLPEQIEAVLDEISTPAR
ncbi:aldo/keto reductase [Paenarthrobacter sp. PH39-S1]|uniref:aldo/keto reductase n=1 Tax=Paenarthrobacter sp. PH39-S1 TaxID=3046204 RepID=UPI0024BB3380|nr:aldo/keto reductase [Paenarthrobacter sp. PH39-S1]MDJ0356761.1 aldo/keto reductase [Paenarthrobacter sp. PH39-S1]